MKKRTKEEIYRKVESVDGFGEMTVNERLFVAGLMDTFDKVKDRELARTILKLFERIENLLRKY